MVPEGTTEYWLAFLSNLISSYEIESMIKRHVNHGMSYIPTPISTFPTVAHTELNSTHESIGSNPYKVYKSVLIG